MAAITTTLFAMLSRGAHVVVTDDSYRRTRQFLNQTLHRYGIECSTVPAGDYDAIAEAIRPNTRILLSESPTNPYNRILDLERFAEIGRRHRVKTIIDATFATPYNQRPLEFGIDLVLHSATKFLGGHNDLMAGAVLGSAEIVDGIRALQGVTGAVLDPFAAYLLIRGLKTLALRIERQNANAQAIAEFLEAHPKDRRACTTPACRATPSTRSRARQMRGFGGVVSFEVAGDLDAATRVVDGCRIPRIAPSLGGVESLIEQPALMSFYELTHRGAPPGRHQGQPDPLLGRHRGRGRPDRRPPTVARRPLARDDPEGDDRIAAQAPNRNARYRHPAISSSPARTHQSEHSARSAEAHGAEIN